MLKVLKVSHQLTFPLATTCPTQNFLPNLFVAALKSFFCFSILLSSFFVLIGNTSLSFSHQQPSLSHKNHISLSNEEIKRFTLKFQLQSLWVSQKKKKKKTSSYFGYFDGVIVFFSFPSLFSNMIVCLGFSMVCYIMCLMNVFYIWGTFM